MEWLDDEMKILTALDILAPLTASTDLPTHPTLSKPFTSKTLTHLVDHSCKIMRRENQSLWEVRHLWTSLCGDGTWLPGEIMMGANDSELYTEDLVAQHLASSSQAGAATNGTAPQQSETEAKDADVTMSDGEAEKAEAKDEDGEKVGDQKDAAKNSSNKEQQAEGTEGKPGGEAAQAESAADENESTFIHPMYLPPGAAKPDRDLGLPESEAEDIRRLMAMYVQKQEEICRGAERLHEGLLRAERLRADVLHWSKAEAHRDLSDGEDWYDKEEWGLTEDLKKGQDEEEEDTTTQGKKTRARRQ